MFPISHVYILKRLVEKELERDLDERDTYQITGTWLLDTLVRKTIRDKYPNTQGYFHSIPFKLKPYPDDDPLMIGVKIHVYSDNLANYGSIRYPEKPQSGVMHEREKKLKLPDSIKVANKLKRRILQSGLDMVIVDTAKEELRKYFSYTVDLIKNKDFGNKVYEKFTSLIKADFDEDFINGPFYYLCHENLDNVAERYGDNFDNQVSDPLRAKAAAEEAGIPKEEMAVIIRQNIQEQGILEGWQENIDFIAMGIKNADQAILRSFE